MPAVASSASRSRARPGRRTGAGELDVLRRERCCSPAQLATELDSDRARRMAQIARALADPVRAGLVEVLRGAPGQVCQCDLGPLFDIAQPTLSHHIRKLEDAGLVRVERRGRWAYYSIDREPLEEIRAWLS